MKNYNYLLRPYLLTICALLLTIPMVFAGTSKHEGPSARWKITKDGKEIGIKLTEDSKGQLMLSAREIKGKKLFLVPLGKPEKGSKSKTHSTKNKLKDGFSLFVEMSRNGRLTTNLKGIGIGPVDYLPGPDNDYKSQGFWDWLGGALLDVVDGIAAGIIYLHGGIANIITDGGYYWEVDGENATIKGHQGSGSGFMLEPGMEEEGNVWY